MQRALERPCLGLGWHFADLQENQAEGGGQPLGGSQCAFRVVGVLLRAVTSAAPRLSKISRARKWEPRMCLFWEQKGVFPENKFVFSFSLSSSK